MLARGTADSGTGAQHIEFGERPSLEPHEVQYSAAHLFLVARYL